MTRSRTIRTRLTLWYVLLLGLVLIFFSVLLNVILANRLNQQMDDGLRQIATEALGTITEDNGHLGLQNPEGDKKDSPLGGRNSLVRIVGLDGKIVESTGPYTNLPVPDQALSAGRQGQSHYDSLEVPSAQINVRLYTVVYQQNGRIYGLLQVGQSLNSIQDILQQLIIIQAIIIPLTLLLASVGGLFLANRALQPIDRITRAARRISAEDLNHHLNLTLPDDEVGQLARTFDDMLTRLHEFFQRQRQFTADASHELRTPLTIMKGDISVALHRPRSNEEYQVVLTELDDEVDRLTRLVEDLLLLANADAHRIASNTEKVDLSDLLEVLVEQMRPLAAVKEQALALKIPQHANTQGDPERLSRLFLNLLDNAIKYTPDAGTITVTLTVEDNQGTTIEFIDSGPGISVEQLPHIFERFYRADVSRSRASGGTGLGLAIAKSIAELHGGRLEVRSTVGHGSVFSVWLPHSGE